LYTPADHTFAICAYGESPYLGECIESLVKQTCKTNIIISTSTPNKFIEEMADYYDLPLRVNNNIPSIAGDWNFALESAATPLVTLAHQDDTYEPEYAQSALCAINDTAKPLIFFTGYGEIRDGQLVSNNKLLKTKRRMLSPLKKVSRQSSRFIRRRILSFGSAICCPSVTYIKSNLPRPLFMQGFKSDLDWQAWELISKIQGSFLYNANILMYHRVHSDSETSKLIHDDARTNEDIKMLSVFWPKPVAKFINMFYRKAQTSNENR
jgi:glycosyltransferase involved in cell wall biosynthesis